jgi:uncharacterized membrane protein
MGENHFATMPVMVYGVVLLLAGIAYFILARILVNAHGQGSTLHTTIGRNNKGLVSVAIYATAIPLTFVNNWIAFSMYVLVALLWIVPDSRIEKSMKRP